MIRLSAWVDEQGAIHRLRVEGHAGAGRYGEDIVCAAVSALVETLALGLKTYGLGSAGHRSLVEEGRAEFWFQAECDPRVEIAVRWIALGLKDLALSHGQFVQWREWPAGSSASTETSQDQ